MGFLDKVKDKLISSPEKMANEANRLLSEAEESLTNNPFNFKAYGQKAQALEKLGKHEEAIKAFDDAINTIDTYYLEKNHDNAELKAEFWRFRGRYITSQANIFDNLGNQSVAHEKHEEALNCYDRAISLNPANNLYWKWKSDTLKALGKKSEANEAYKVAMKLTEQQLGLSPGR